MEEKKGRGLGKGLSELLGEARAKAAIAKQAKSEISVSQDKKFKQVSQNIEGELQKDLGSVSNVASQIIHNNKESVENKVMPQNLYDKPYDENDFETVSVKNFNDENQLKNDTYHEASNPQQNQADNFSNEVTHQELNDDFSGIDELDQLEAMLEQENLDLNYNPDTSSRDIENMSSNFSETQDELSNISPEQNQDQDDTSNNIHLIEEINNIDQENNAQSKASKDFLQENKLFNRSIESKDKVFDLNQKTKINIDVKEKLSLNESKLSEEFENNQDDFLEEQNIAQTNNELTIHYLPIEVVRPCKIQPRKYFNEELLKELADSVKIYGIIQPIIVKEVEGGQFEIIGGERRWRASHMAGLKSIPAIIKDYTHETAYEVSLIENIQRTDLSPLDEARAYSHLIDKYELTQNELSQKIGKSRSYIANMIRLLDLKPDICNYLDSGHLTVGHARALIGVKDAETWAKRAIKENMSVRKLEELIGNLPEKGNSYLPKASNNGKNSDILALEADLKAALGVSVFINAQTPQKGNMVIRYDSLEQLDEICRRLCSNWGNEHV